MTRKSACYTLCHMKTISIRELHEKTGEWIRKVDKHGEIYVTDRGKTVARILPQANQSVRPYFSHRKISAAFGKLLVRGRLRGGTDSTQMISEDRERPIS